MIVRFSFVPTQLYSLFPCLVFREHYNDVFSFNTSGVQSVLHEGKVYIRFFLHHYPLATLAKGGGINYDVTDRSVYAQPSEHSTVSGHPITVGPGDIAVDRGDLATSPVMAISPVGEYDVVFAGQQGTLLLSPDTTTYVTSNGGVLSAKAVLNGDHIVFQVKGLNTEEGDTSTGQTFDGYLKSPPFDRIVGVTSVHEKPVPFIAYRRRRQ
jgi:hypothetical protein